MISLVGSENHHTTYTYDNLLRVTQVIDRIVDDEYTTRYSYDVYGRIKNIVYPTNYNLVSYYNEHGYLSHYREGSSNNKVWEALEINALGQINRFATGNGLETTHTYYPGNARLHTVQTKAGSLNPIQDMEYGWDELGNLNYRKKWIDRNNDIYLNESFKYDVLNRLDTIHLNEMETGLHEYDKDGLGNMVMKKADNNVVFANGAYEGSRPHALRSAHVNDNLLAYTSNDQAIGWTSFDQPEYIEQGSNRLEFTYGHHHQRIRQLYRNENGETTKTFAGNCEFVNMDGQQYSYTYLSGPTGLFGIHVKNPDGTSGLFYIHTDHLGSLHTITNENGNLLQELSFDAWGSRRNPATWTMFDKNAETALFDRGFTGHEHLDGFQLINMNGRLYDPVVSRMLSPDNYVQSPDFSQSFNRYSYCFNNPLIYTDPSGDIPLIAIVGIFAGANLVTDLVQNDFKMNIGEIGLSIGLGALQGAMSASGFSATATGWTVLGSAAVGQLNRLLPTIPIFYEEGISIGISPSILSGTHGLGLGTNLNIDAHFDDLRFGASFGLTYYSRHEASGQKFLEKRAFTYAGVLSSDGGFIISENRFYGGEFTQTTGGLTIMAKIKGEMFSSTYENDWIGGVVGDGGDRWRTAGVRLEYADFSLGINLFTGNPNDEGTLLMSDRKYDDVNGHATYIGGTADNYRFGGLYAGYKNYRVGANSETIRHIAQNRFAHDLLTKGDAKYFKVLDNKVHPYFAVKTRNGYSTW